LPSLEELLGLFDNIYSGGDHALQKALIARENVVRAANMLVDIDFQRQQGPHMPTGFLMDVAHDDLLSGAVAVVPCPAAEPRPGHVALFIRLTSDALPTFCVGLWLPKDPDLQWGGIPPGKHAVLAVHPHTLMATRCAKCGMTVTGDVRIRCMSCKVARYCSLDCLADHHAVHKGPCQHLAAEQCRVLLPAACPPNFSPLPIPMI